MGYSKLELLNNYHSNLKDLIAIREKRNLQILGSQSHNKKKRFEILLERNQLFK